jgi:transketolase
VGLALALRLNKLAARVFVLCGDGETNEGSVWEACLSAAKHGLDTFTLIVDRNGQQSWDDTETILPLEPYAEKFQAFGFSVAELNGHDLAALEKTLLSLPLAPGKPSCLICRTVKGKGLPSLERNLAWHHKTKLSEREYAHLAMELEAAEHKAAGRKA